MCGKVLWDVDANAHCGSRIFRGPSLLWLVSRLDIGHLDLWLNENGVCSAITYYYLYPEEFRRFVRQPLCTNYCPQYSIKNSDLNLCSWVNMPFNKNSSSVFCESCMPSGSFPCFSWGGITKPRLNWMDSIQKHRLPPRHSKTFYFSAKVS